MRRPPAVSARQLKAGQARVRGPGRVSDPLASPGGSPPAQAPHPSRNSPLYSKHWKLTRWIWLMWSILVAIAARIHHVSQIHHGNGTLTHYRGLRDDGMHGHRGRGSTYDPSTPRALEGPEVHAPRMVD